MLRRIGLIVVLILASVAAYGQRPFHISVKSNMLHDLFAVPNVGVEIPFGRNWSAGVDWDYIWLRDYRHNRHWRIEGGDVFLRYWPGRQRQDRPRRGHHVEVYGQMYTFQIQLSDSHGFISGIPGQNLTGHPGWGVGVGYGYSLPLSPRFNLDFSIGCGYYTTELNRYRPDPGCQCGCDHCYVLEKRTRHRWFGPSRVEFSLVWNIGRGNINRDR